jgi:phosphoribosylformylglycinamidine cyclo-ligase
VTTSSYAAAGVDIEAGDRAVDLIKRHVARTTRSEVRTGLGGFSGLFALDLAKYRRPLLASTTDGVGTKLVIAQMLDKHDTVGQDLVAMVVDDLVVDGAEPLFLQDYIALGKNIPERTEQIVSGIADGCVLAGCAIVGGEMAEHPGTMADDHYDLAATAVGVVEEDAVLGADRIQLGDVVIALGSSGVHSNGFSLVRHVLLKGAGMSLDAHVDDLGTTLGESLLTPTRIYAKDCLAIIEETDVRAFSHVTGGGLAANLARVLPDHLTARLQRNWTVPAIFDLVRTTGQVEQAEMERTFNMGVGMIAIVPPADVDRTMALLTARHVDSWVLGEMVAGDGSAVLEGTHPA